MAAPFEMALTPEQKAEYAKRLKWYHKYRVPPEAHGQLGQQAKSYGLSMMKYASAVMRQQAEDPRPLKLTSEGKTWTHSQCGVVPPHLKRPDEIAAALQAIRVRQAFSEGRTSVMELDDAFTGRAVMREEIELDLE